MIPDGRSPGSLHPSAISYFLFQVLGYAPILDLDLLDKLLQRRPVFFLPSPFGIG
jgi:hypothetical protein